MDSVTLKSLCDMTYGLYIVSSRDGDRLNGQIVNTAFQVTAEPARIAVGINRKNLTHDYITRTGRYTLAALAQSAPMTFIGLFGFRSGRDTDKFAVAGHGKTASGLPVPKEHTLSVLEVLVEKTVELDTHTLFIGTIAGAEKIAEGEPLTYSYYHNVLKGKTQKNATTYNS
ncbi:MAG: flavin reductase family protein [Elusimicrobiaceae bacterium]|nr:flavin reductase family protein [Elusimicrobiaceae bacterium]